MAVTKYEIVSDLLIDGKGGHLAAGSAMTAKELANRGHDPVFLLAGGYITKQKGKGK